MSSRALRKLKKVKDDFEEEVVDDVDEQEESEEEIQVSSSKSKKKSTASSFSMLNLDDDDDDDDNNDNEDKDQDQDEEDEDDNDKQSKIKSKQQQPNNNSNNNKKKKKQQKKKSKTNNNNNNNNNNSKNNNNNNKDDIDKLVNEITSTITNNSFQQNEEQKKYREILSVDPKHLNASNELKKLFGCKVSDMKEMKKKNSNVHTNVNMMKKKSWMFVAPQQEWPEIIQSFVMELDRTEGDVNYFTIRWSDSYRRLQEDFYEVLASHDPMHIAELLRYHPYHVDSLLQLSQVCLQTADYQHAGDFVERAIFAFEYCWHHLFNPTSGTSRLEYKHQENKTCFLSVFRHIQILGRRACPRTALEFCKVLLSLDYSDPLFVRLIIDYYALKSKQYEYLVELYTKVGKLTPSMTQTLDLLPNFCYNGALAQFMLVGSGGGNNEDAADKLLQKALIRFPMVLKPLLQKLQASLMIVKDGKPFNLEEHPYFKSTNELLKPVEHLIALYVERNHPLWKQQPTTIEWLKKNVEQVIKLVDAKDKAVEESVQLVLKEYSVVDQSVFDHLFLSEYSDVVQRLPPDVIEMMRNEGFNNIEPPRGQDPRRGIGAGYQVYRAPRVIQQRQQVVQQQQQQTMEQRFMEQLQQIQPNIDPNNPLLGFIQSLFPWNAQQQQQQGGQPQAARGFLDDYVDMIYDEDEDDQQQQQGGQQQQPRNNRQRRR
ncbi:Nulp1-type basic helix-loop-helix domain-containing protein [Heterostelium album PN500]|uniref:Nulp1-type basic helix-loop-helix domain-containing protein n=1 Tax=Heterostelium pallidum (strain ATCC 26659 / Pp 5 / PN500) TaxID=670386 RepID=D3B954_HETP5|nr:Nulp1-type basic helix-loop-helix domain-containing protein [Heterostelium album PN500]EFA82093.1 Nulp1-type basic helix-loop-helix domain-containing protein [Heterostelium album PN500]|eukprot:XP_020434210.1 Nulp1-type basic helix-loop-helix domain-containing protein [Heterostelium album PN500]